MKLCDLKALAIDATMTLWMENQFFPFPPVNLWSRLLTFPGLR